jgi:hypothetical protein
MQTTLKEASMTLEKLVPSWLRRDDDGLGTVDAYEIPPLPTTAELPKPPSFSADDEDKMIFGKAAVLLEQLKRDRQQAQQREDDLKGQLAEAVLARAGDCKKIDFLEMENSELRTTISTLQSDNNALRELMSKTRAIWDLFGIKAPEKKRKPKKSSVTIEKVSKD